MGFSKSNNVISEEEVRPVFIDTNLGTKFAVTVSTEVTVNYFKRYLEMMHLHCFPEFGSIRVNALMVKRKSQCYHLSESLPLKYVFLGSNRTWFLQMDACRLISPNLVQSFQSDGTEFHNRQSAHDDEVTDSVQDLSSLMCSDEKRVNLRRKKRKIRRFLYLRAVMLKIFAIFCFSKGLMKTKNFKRKYFKTRAEVNWSKKLDTANVIDEAAVSETSSGSVVSVSGIIKKYFTDYDEVTSTSSSFPFTTVRDSADCKYVNNVQYKIMSPVKEHIPPQVSQDEWLEKPNSEVAREKKPRKPEVGREKKLRKPEASREKKLRKPEASRGKKTRKPEVGNRLLRASNNLGLTPSNQRPTLSLCKSNDRKAPSHNSGAAVVRHLVFEIPEESD